MFNPGAWRGSLEGGSQGRPIQGIWPLGSEGEEAPERVRGMRWGGVGGGVSSCQGLPKRIPRGQRSRRIRGQSPARPWKRSREAAPRPGPYRPRRRRPGPERRVQGRRALRPSGTLRAGCGALAAWVRRSPGAAGRRGTPREAGGRGAGGGSCGLDSSFVVRRDPRRVPGGA